MKTSNGTTFYLLGQPPKAGDLARYGLNESVRYCHVYPSTTRYLGLVAAKTDQYRCPLKGEWYISGAEPQAYRAPNDLLTPFQIARLTFIKTATAVIDCDGYGELT